MTEVDEGVAKREERSLRTCLHESLIFDKEENSLGTWWFAISFELNHTFLIYLSLITKLVLALGYNLTQYLFIGGEF